MSKSDQILKAQLRYQERQSVYGTFCVPATKFLKFSNSNMNGGDYSEVGNMCSAFLPERVLSVTLKKQTRIKIFL